MEEQVSSIFTIIVEDTFISTRPLIFNELHCVTLLKIEVFITTDVRSSDPTLPLKFGSITGSVVYNLIIPKEESQHVSGTAIIPASP